MKELRIRTLVGLFLIAVVLAWGASRMWDQLGTPPVVPVAAPIVLAVIGTVLLATALSLRARLRAQRERRPGAKGVEPMMAARALVFGQASALVVSLVSGAYGGIGLFLLLSGLEVPARRDQAVYAALSVAAGVAVVAAALFLERVCRLPEDPEDEDGDPPAAARA
ncbi:DUF3180 domain-containing protein [Streptomyces sp. NPDC005438]|uniref:DUF3180 domain-containing protein n=1 Tax=Streptomyces sp. NPDC005438 TaxID=3156880 RepID=UPI0033AADD06